MECGQYNNGCIEEEKKRAPPVTQDWLRHNGFMCSSGKHPSQVLLEVREKCLVLGYELSL